jgi:hypothetical protein
MTRSALPHAIARAGARARLAAWHAAWGRRLEDAFTWAGTLALVAGLAHAIVLGGMVLFLALTSDDLAALELVFGAALLTVYGAIALGIQWLVTTAVLVPVAVAGRSLIGRTGRAGPWLGACLTALALAAVHQVAALGWFFGVPRGPLATGLLLGTGAAGLLWGTWLAPARVAGRRPAAPGAG